jgi:hypothetical protein
MLKKGEEEEIKGGDAAVANEEN